MLVARVTLGIFASIIIGMFCLVNIHSYYQLRQVKEFPRETNGFVSELKCGDHGAMFYSYIVNGKEYKSLGRSCTSICQKTIVGESIKVIYSLKNPEYSVRNNFEASEVSINTTSLMLFVASVVISILIYRVTKQGELKL